MAVLCPVAGKPGRRVSTVTVRSLIREEQLPEVGEREWYFCDLPECEVVYFATDGMTLLKDALRVRVGVKESTAPRPVCYCFGHTVEGIRDESGRTGRCTVLASIAARVKAQECRCEVMNPKGTCCLGDVKKAVDEALASIGPSPQASSSSSNEPEPPSHDCCAVVAERTTEALSSSRHGRAGILAAVASVLSAIIATACCWLPLLLAAFGLSAGGASAMFEGVRPFFLVLAPLFLGIGFYFVYFRKEAVKADTCCPPGTRKGAGFQRTMLRGAAGVVLTIAFFPDAIPRLLGRSQSSPEAAPGDPRSVLISTIHIEGMTCESCGLHVERELSAVPGVRQVRVDFEKKLATLIMDAAAPLPLEVLLKAVERAGYRAQPVGPKDPAGSIKMESQ